MIQEHVISIARLVKDLDDANKEQYVTNEALRNVKCQIQPAGAEQLAFADGVYGQTYMCFTTQSGILTGDKVTVSGTGQVLRVRGIEDWSQVEGIPHFELTLVAPEEEEIIG